MTGCENRLAFKPRTEREPHTNGRARAAENTWARARVLAGVSYTELDIICGSKSYLYRCVWSYSSRLCYVDRPIPGAWLHFSAGRARDQVPSTRFNLNQGTDAEDALPVDRVAGENWANLFRRLALSLRSQHVNDSTVVRGGPGREGSW